MKHSKGAIIRFLIFLIGSLALLFLIHTQLLSRYDYSPYENLIVLSYCINALVAAAIFTAIFLFRYRLKNYIGFLFIIGSFIKFVMFFIIFYPVYRADGKMDKLEFAAFFVPYLVSLLVETIFSVKMLKKLDNKSA